MKVDQQKKQRVEAAAVQIMAAMIGQWDTDTTELTLTMPHFTRKALEFADALIDAVDLRFGETKP